MAQGDAINGGTGQAPGSRVLFVGIALLAVAGAAAFIAAGVSDALVLTPGAASIALVAAPAIAAISCAIRASDPRSKARVIWGLLALFCALWIGRWAVEGAAAEVTAATEFVLRIAPYPFFLAVAVFLLRSAGSVNRVRAALDAALAAVSLLYLEWVLVVLPLRGQGFSVDGLWLELSYPVADAAVAAVALVAVPRVQPSARRLPLLLLAALAAVGFSDGAHAYLTATGDHRLNHPAYAGWLFAFLLIGAGAWHVRGDRPARLPGSVAKPAWFSVVAPYLLVLPVVANLAWVLGSGRQTGPVRTSLAAALLAILSVRHILTAIESDRRARSLAHRLNHDALTGLLNREALRAELEDALAEDKSEVAVLFIDLDNFKDVNDSFGHSTGDRLLQEVAQILQSSVRSEDAIARLGGDEFAVLLCGATHVADAIRVAERITRQLPTGVGNGDDTTVSASVGIALGHGAVDTAETVLRNADLAMYSAKRKGRNRYEMYEPELHADVVQRLDLVRRLERAMINGEFVLHYQPKIDLETGGLVGAEALLRWEDGNRCIRPPEFMTAVEETGLIVPLGKWVLEEACAFLERLERAGLLGPQFEMCINVSGAQLEGDGVAKVLKNAMERHNVDPSRIVLELTESTLIDSARALDVMRDLKALGVKLAVDDFGTGYSSLRYLQRFPVDFLKIDRSFIAEMDRGVEGGSMAQAITLIAQSLRLETIAEGVERRTQVDALRDLGCPYAQGYLFSEPVSEEDFCAYAVADPGVEVMGFEPTASALRTLRSAN